MPRKLIINRSLVLWYMDGVQVNDDGNVDYVVEIQCNHSPRTDAVHISLPSYLLGISGFNALLKRIGKVIERIELLLELVVLHKMTF